MRVDLVASWSRESWSHGNWSRGTGLFGDFTQHCWGFRPI